MDDPTLTAPRREPQFGGNQDMPGDLDAPFRTLVQSPLRAGLLRFLNARPQESFELDALMSTFGRLRLDIENCITELIDFGVVCRLPGSPARVGATRPGNPHVADLLDGFLERRAHISTEDQSPSVQRFREMIGRDEKMLVVFEWIRTAALTSEGPRHQAISSDAARALIQQDAGAAFDPQVVTVFSHVMSQLYAEARQEESTTSKPGTRAGAPGVELETIGGGNAGATGSVFDDIALAHREIFALYQIAQTMGTSLGVSDTMALISSKLSNLVPFDSCALFLYSDETESLVCRFATGTDAALLRTLTLRSGQGLAGWVARQQRPLVNARPSADLEAMHRNARTALESALVCPLLFDQRLIGTLAVYYTESSFYRDDHRRLLDSVCEQAAAVIHNAILFEQTQEDSLTDPLTGLPNTRSMFMHLANELARARRLTSEVSLLVLDLNGFKDVNDHHGHHVGDNALRAIADVLRAAIRPYDICVRYAGDEFIVVLSGCGRAEAEQKRAELQDAVDRLPFEASPGIGVPLSISAGAAVFPHDGDSYESLLAAADSRVYRDKSLRKHNPTRQLGTGPATADSTDQPGRVSRAV